MPLLCLQTFSGNSSTLNSNCGYRSISKSAFRFASSISLERAVALDFCESELDWADWAFEFAAFEFIFFVKLENDGGFGGTLSSGIDGKLVVRAMYVVCVLYRWERQSLSELI